MKIRTIAGIFLALSLLFAPLVVGACGDSIWEGKRKKEAAIHAAGGVSFEFVRTEFYKRENGKIDKVWIICDIQYGQEYFVFYPGCRSQCIAPLFRDK